MAELLNTIDDLNIDKIIDNVVEEVSYIAMERIRALPQVLQDRIAEYNVDHRPQMFPVHRQIIQPAHIPRMNQVFRELVQTVDRYGATHSDNCTNYIKEYNRIDTTFYGNTYHYCCDQCQWESVYDMRKSTKRDMQNQKLSV
jgi:hypothetical protein